jgi:hypothetical protein
MAEISANKARTIIRKAMALGTEKGFKALSVVVLDSGGHVKAGRLCWAWQAPLRWPVLNSRLISWRQ